jgi:hypothetical protein
MSALCCFCVEALIPVAVLFMRCYVSGIPQAFTFFCIVANKSMRELAWLPRVCHSGEIALAGSRRLWQDQIFELLCFVALLNCALLRAECSRRTAFKQQLHWLLSGCPR